MKTTLLGVVVFQGVTLFKVDVHDAEGKYLDGACGQFWEIAEWLESRGYPRYCELSPQYERVELPAGSLVGN